MSIKTMIRDKIFNDDGNVFLTGPAGVGKSELIRHIVASCPVDRHIGVTATTGVAANLIGGMTLNSFFGIGLGTESVFAIVRNVKRLSACVDRWRRVDTLIIDEVGMLTAELLDKLERVARIMRKSDTVFGNIRLVFAGDFLQLPCINGKPCFESAVWKDLKLTIFYFHKSVRQIDSVFRRVLNNARIGQLTDEDADVLSSRASSLASNEDESAQCKTVVRATKIYCKNVDVDEINERRLYALNNSKLYRYDVEIVRHASNVSDEFIGRQCNAPTHLKLAVGAQVMLIYNLDQSNGLVNGSRGVVVAFDGDSCPIVRFANCTRPIAHQKWDLKLYDVTVATVYQIPLKLAYAITVHKSQGCTLDAAYIDLKDVFEYGQAYVAVSRVKDLRSLTLVNFHRDKFKANPTSLNYYADLNKTFECDDYSVYED